MNDLFLGQNPLSLSVFNAEIPYLFLRLHVYALGSDCFPTAVPLENRAHLNSRLQSISIVLTVAPECYLNLLTRRERGAMPTDATALAANFGIVSTGAKGTFSMPVFAKTICSTLKPSHMPRHRWVKGLFFLFESVFVECRSCQRIPPKLLESPWLPLYQSFSDCASCGSTRAAVSSFLPC